MKSFFTLAELAAARLPGLPSNQSGLHKVVIRENWRAHEDLSRRVPGKTNAQWEYHISLLPKAAQTRLLIVHSTPANDDAEVQAERKRELWSRYETLSLDQKIQCEDRLTALVLAEELIASGLTATAAAKVAAKKSAVSAATFFNWRSMTHGVDRPDWLAALAPTYASNGERSECHISAWEFIKSDFLRPEKPTFSACYRRMVKTAKKEGWSPIASEKSLRRRLKAEVPEAVQVLARSGKDKAKTLYPAQRRTRSHLHAMQMVNIDGHRIDVFVDVPWSEKPVRMYLVVIQDLFSGKIVAWRLADSENKETVRLVIGDMVEHYGIPDAIYLDNGRAFASKWISGGTATRFRFKVRDEDPRGLLVTLGIEPHFTTPYSGQSKPIERAFRDLADMIAKHPFCAGAYTGNRPDAKPENYMSRAVDLDGFRMHIVAQIADHNSQAGRKADNCKGRSFDETFEASINDPATIVRWPTAAQRSLWLLASELLRTKKGSGEIHYHGNRYWSRELNQFTGKKVTIRFDPDDLHSSVKVYDLDNSLICEAACIEDAGFDDVDKARLHARHRGDFQKALAAQKRAHAALTAQQLADIIYKGNTAVPEPQPLKPRVTRLVTGNLALNRGPVDAIDDDTLEDSFSKALSLVSGEASIIEFPKGNEPRSIEYGSKKKGGRNPAR